MPDSCVICDEASAEINEGPDWFQVRCPRCGNFRISGSAAPGLASYDQRDREILMGSVRNATERGERLDLTTASIPRLLEEAAAPSDPNEAVDLLLEHVARRTQRPGHVVTLERGVDFPLLYTNDRREFEYYVQYAVERGLLEGRGSNVKLTPAGWERLDELRKTSARPNQAFVAMWFDEDLDEAWTQGFRPALEEAGYDPLRVDLQEHNEKICDRIIKEIRRSGLLVADFTGHRGGVYFEAGFAMGLGIPVIWTCREGDMGGAHFDTRQYSHTVWSDAEDSRRRLVDRIQATVPLQE